MNWNKLFDRKKHGQRVGQLIWNSLHYTGFKESSWDNKMFYIEDKDLEKLIKKYLKLTQSIKKGVSNNYKRSPITLERLSNLHKFKKVNKRKEN